MYLTIERNGKHFDTAVTPTLGERIGRGLRRLGRARARSSWAPVEARYAGREGRA